MFVQFKCVQAVLKGVVLDKAQRHQLMPHQTFHMTGNEQTPIWLPRDKIRYATSFH